MALSAHTADPKTCSASYDQEVRFGVVMYGGVSLAIYINGVANEMYEMVSATPRLKPECLVTGTREIYRRLSWLIGNPELRDKYAALIKNRTRQAPEELSQDVWKDTLLDDNVSQTRLVVDVIAGTSAGGINGIFLAKALVNGEQFSRLKDLWIDEADIGKLLNDRKSFEGLGKYKQNQAPNSLLNGDRMYLKLLQAMNNMRSNSRPGVATTNFPLTDEMDLFVTTTDINGSAVPLRLSHDVVYERRYKQCFHLKYSSEGYRCNDFAPDDRHNAFLAFAARCTSSFPFAFEPMTLKAASHFVKKDCFKQLEKHSFFTQFTKNEFADDKFLSRPFGDGGYLDNKPFTYVAKTLSIRQAFVPVDRILLYVEPAPENLQAQNSARPGELAPDALSNSLDALTNIPRYETIREDLQAILKRNRRIERIERIIREGEVDLHCMLSGESNPFVHILREKGGAVPPFPQFGRKDMVTYFGTAFLSYRRMRVSSVSDKIAERLAELFGTDRASDHRYAMTALVREWRDRHYQEEPTEHDELESINQFLCAFDVGYRIRKIGFLLRQVDHLTRVIRKIHTETEAAEKMHSLFVLDKKKFNLLPESDQWSIRHLEEGKLQLRDGQQDRRNLGSALAALAELKHEFNAVQAVWRRHEHERGEGSVDAAATENMLRKELNAVLMLLLGNSENNPVELTTMSGKKVTIKLPEQTIKALSEARTMQESVMIRARALHERARHAERTRLHDALENSLAAISSFPDVPRLWDKLGKPQLKLADQDPKNSTLRLDVDDVGNEVLDSFEGKLMRQILGEYYVYFDLFDQMSFPLYNGSDIGEPCTVEVVRISPNDATTLVDEKLGDRRKLAGTAFSNFGGFLDRPWRINDIMWGRLDGAERLIRALLPMSDESTVTVRRELTELANRIILRETFLPECTDRMVGLLHKSADENRESRATLEKTLGLTKQLDKTSPSFQKQLREMLSMLLDDQELVGYVKRNDVNRVLDPKTTLENASRAVTIVGRMFEEIKTRQGKKSTVFRWLVRSGLMFQALVAFALPGSLRSRLWPHFITVIYIFEGVWLLFGFVIGSAGAKAFAVTALLLTGTIHLAIVALRDVMGTRSWIVKALPLLASSIVIFLIYAGIIALVKFKLQLFLA